MSQSILGIGAAPGRAMGQVRLVLWQIPPAPHRTIEPEDVQSEVERFREARWWARQRIEQQRARTASTLGEVEAKIFDPQVLMLEDPDLVDGAVAYITQNFLSAERAFDWRITELKTQMLNAGHQMIVDRLADLEDVRYRVLARLGGADEDPLVLPVEPGILAFPDLTPSVAVRLDPEIVQGLIIGSGSRTSHSAVLARSLSIPAVVGVGPDLEKLRDGAQVLLDGATGRIVADPDPDEVQAHARMRDRLSEWTAQGAEWMERELESADGQRVTLVANLDQPDDVEAARRVGARGVGLFRSEFLVIGRRVIPSEQEQFQAYRKVVRAFPEHPVTLRTFDIGGDKFPLFLDMPPEENPYLGWRAIRVCLDLPELFENQLSAALRAGAEGTIRILLPFVTRRAEVRRTRDILERLSGRLGIAPVDLGIMVETPGAVEILDLLAEDIDFVSLGSNDLTQYVLAVDRGNARLAHLADPLHPAMVRVYRRVFDTAAAHGLGISVCGDLASDPVGLGVLLGLGYREFSLAPSSVPEVRELVRALPIDEAAALLAGDSWAVELGGIRERMREFLAEVSPYGKGELGPASPFAEGE